MNKKNKYYRDKRYKHKLKKLNEQDLSYPAPVYYITEKYNKNEHRYEDVKKPYYTRIYKGRHYTKLKRYSHKKFRRTNKSELYQGNQYRKDFDLFWEWL